MKGGVGGHGCDLGCYSMSVFCAVSCSSVEAVEPQAHLFEKIHWRHLPLDAVCTAVEGVVQMSH